jgi:hypothetical protein
MLRYVSTTKLTCNFKFPLISQLLYAKYVLVASIFMPHLCLNEENYNKVAETKIFQYVSNKTQRYTVYYICKLFYMFRVVTPPVIRSVQNCIYSIWYLSDRYCYLPLAVCSK